MVPKNPGALLARTTRAEGGDSVSHRGRDAPTDRPRPAPVRRRGVLARLFDRFGGGANGRLDVRIATLTGSEASDEDTQRLVRAFDGRPGIRARRLGRPFSLEPAIDEAQALVATAAAGRQLLVQARADLLVWGDIPSPGTTANLRFIPAAIRGEEQLGSIGPASTLSLPVVFESDLAEVLIAVALSAMTPITEGRAAALAKALPAAFDSATDVVGRLPSELTARERATVHACMGDVAARLAAVRNDSALLATACEHYGLALKSLSKDEAALHWAMVQKNLGLALLVRADMDGDTERLEAGIDALRAALQVLARDRFPRTWAAAQKQLGEALYRLDAKTGDHELIKHAVAAYQSALQVYNRSETPNQWAETLHNFALAAQLLGEQVQNAEVIEKAVEACRAALAVRTRETAPLLWAATQNTLGSALFLLAKQNRNSEALDGAEEAFTGAAEVYTAHGVEAGAQIAEKNLARVRQLFDRRGPRDPESQRPETPTPDNP